MDRSTPFKKQRDIARFRYYTGATMEIKGFHKSRHRGYWMDGFKRLLVVRSARPAIIKGPDTPSSRAPKRDRRFETSVAIEQFVLFNREGVW